MIRVDLQPFGTQPCFHEKIIGHGQAAGRAAPIEGLWTVLGARPALGVWGVGSGVGRRGRSKIPHSSDLYGPCYADRDI